MISVLHLVGPDAPVSTSNGVAILSRADDAMRSAVMRIGRGGDFRSALAAAATLRFAPVPFDLIHAWDPASFAAAIGSGGPVVYSVDTPICTGEVAWIAAARVPNVRIVASSNWARQKLVRSGIPAARCGVIAPATAMPAVAPDAQSRAAIRAALGFNESDFVILAPGESIRAANHAAALHAVSILHVLNPRFRLLLWGRGPMTRGLKQLSQRLDHPHAVVCAEDIERSRFLLTDLATASDVAVLSATEPAPTAPIITCAAMGLPIVAYDTPLARELFSAETVATVPPPHKPRVLAQTLLRLSEDATRAADLSARARSEASQRFIEAKFRESHISIYRGLVTPTVERLQTG